MPEGIAVSPGIVIGRAYVFEQYPVKMNMENISESEITAQIEQFDRAVEQSKAQLLQIQKRMEAGLGMEKAGIIDAHLMILEDETFICEMRNVIQTEKITAEHAVDTVTKLFLTAFESFEDEYTKERAGDIRDVSGRLIKNVLNVPIKNLSNLEDKAVVIARDLTPTDTAQMDRKRVLAFATDMGGRTSHTAIMARSMGVPAVMGLTDFSKQVSDHDLVIVDGCTGMVYVNPDKELLTRYQTLQKDYQAYRQRLYILKDLPAQTRDHQHQVKLFANIGTPSDVKIAMENGAEGIGLFRTEFLYMNRSSLPTEEEQFKAYRQVAENMAPMPVTVRTIDIGGDKNLPYLNMPREENPFLGYRAIRICLDRPQMFRTQLRAILRASHYGSIRIMYPMISGAHEILRANAILEETKEELRSEGVPFDAGLAVGIMVETPAAAVEADLLAKYVDFFSIGTNDLIQYTLAVDRMNERVSDLYEPLHPSVLRLIKYVIDAAHRAGKQAGMCGEMAGDSAATAILLGLGLDEFSMSASSICRIKEVVRTLTMEKSRRIARQALELDNPGEIRALVEQQER